MTTTRKDAEEAAKEYAARHYTVTGSDKQDSFLAGYAHRDAEVEALRKEYNNACELVAKMHAAAQGGEITGPKVGVIEDIELLYSENKALKTKIALSQPPDDAEGQD